MNYFSIVCTIVHKGQNSLFPIGGPKKNLKIHLIVCDCFILGKRKVFAYFPKKLTLKVSVRF